MTLNYRIVLPSDLLVKDIKLGLDGSSPQDLVSFKDELYFSANENSSNREMWRSDGTQAGTMSFNDFFGPFFSSNPGDLTTVNNTLFFRANGGGTDREELWKTNGTEAGTVLVKNINPNANEASSPQNLINVNDTLFFTADDGTHGIELWKSDGTESGTVLVKDINPNANSSIPENLTNVKGTVFFTADDGTHGIELWRSDGTEAGTILLEDIHSNPSNFLFPRHLTAVNNYLYFTATTAAETTELWRSDGTPAGTELFKDIIPGTGSSDPDHLTNANGTLFFTADDGAHGRELWKSDGTDTGTTLVKDIISGPGNSNITNVTNVNGSVFFSTDDGIHGFEPWQSDGTDLGTELVKDINPMGNSFPRRFVNVNGVAYFLAYGGASGFETWRSDGTETGTIMFGDIFPGQTGSDMREPVNVNGQLFFNARGDLGHELYKDPEIISNFTDVPPGSFGFQFIEDFFGAGVSEGCGDSNFCPNDFITRAQLAIFLVKVVRGAAFNPRPAVGMFNDVPIGSDFAPWIEQLALDSITEGCQTNLFCPDDIVTRDQAAMFILKAIHGAGFMPPLATGLFMDVPANNLFAPWIELLALNGITEGCDSNHYCPQDLATRVQLALMVVKAFNLKFVP